MNVQAQPGEGPSMPSPEQVDAALQAFRRGSHAEFDRLVGEDGDGGPSICALLAALVPRPD